MGTDTVRAALAVPPEERVTLVGLRVSFTPAGADSVLRLTVPRNPPTLARVMLSIREDPAGITRLVGAADRVKPGMVTETWTVLWRLPLVPVTVTLYAPDGVVVEAETVRAELPDPFGARVTVAVLREAEGPCGVTSAVRDTVPENPPRLVIVIVDVFVFPGGTIREGGVVDIVKSCTVFTCRV